MWDPNSVSPPDLPFPMEQAFDSPENARIFRESVLRWLKERVAEVEAILLGYDAFDFIANFTLKEMAYDPENYAEPTHEGMAAVVEYIALLYLKHPYNLAREKVIKTEVLAEVRERIVQIISTLQLSHRLDSAAFAQSDKDRALESLSFRTVAQETLVRSPGYPHHEEQNLLALFTPFSEWMEANLGLAIQDVFRVDKAFSSLSTSRFYERLEEAREFSQQFLSQAETLRRKGSVSPSEIVGDDTDLLHDLAAMDADKAEQKIRAIRQAWLTNYLGTDTFASTMKQLSESSGVSSERVEAVLRFFALEFESQPKDWFLLGPTHALKTHPFLHHEGVSSRNGI